MVQTGILSKIMSSTYPHITGWANYQDDYYDGTTAAKTMSIASGTDYPLPINAQSSITSQVPQDLSDLFVPITIDYDAETGAFTEGLVLTGGTSAATARITHVEDNGTTGTLYLGEVSGTFADDEIITDTSTGSATANGAVDFGGITGRNGDSIIYTIDLIAKPIGGGAASYFEMWVDIGGSVGELYRRITTFPKGAGVERRVVATTLAYTLDTWEANKGIIYVSADGDLDIYSQRIVISPSHRAR